MREVDLAGSWPAKSWGKKPSSFDERYLVDLLQRGHSAAGFIERRFSQERHPFIARDAFDLRRGPLVQNHLADMLAQIQQLMDGRAASEAGAAAFKATGTFIEDHIAPL